ncbi:hypothetical protein FSARC_3352 [Fusarium sarcochroum]|uniref:Uncharacterized protein n=1 Tax=Fusarium sarcochroum TaxID=1208366 RepID=A0A8H4XCQ7_9HYPO|nr:hypothetical protein FSARC_3352 [Fusarium sarcochroum]
MKTTTFAVALLGLFPAIFAQETIAPSPTESVGCEPHGDHWHCEAARTDAASAEEASASETIAPSPTESVGCEPHGDHWHCEGARSTLATEVTATSEAEHDHEHDEHDHDETGTESIAPSPTESTGCEPHGDHWHCEAARTGSDASATTESEHEHSAGATESLAPSPTESVGCEPHGDHWHCDGPATAASGTPTASDSAAVTDNVAGMQMVPLVGMVAAAVLAL